MAAVAAATATVGLTWILVLGRGAEAWLEWIPHNAFIAVASAVIAWLVLPAQPRNNAVWVFAWAGLLTGLEVIGYAVLSQAIESLGIGGTVLQLVPNELPLWAALLLQQVNWMWLGVLLVILVLPLFPDGRPPSPRWRPVVWGVLAAFGLHAGGLIWQASPSSTTPIALTQDTNAGIDGPAASMVTISYPLIFLFAILGAAALVTRYRRSVGEERLQFRWVAWGATVLGVMLASSLLIDEVAGRLDIALFTGAVAMLAFIGSVGIAIGRYRLYGIDIVISRSFVYGVLALFITVSYIVVVVGAARLLALDADAPVLSIAATAGIAAAVQPLRRRLERVANRLVYGRRATPYEVLSDFSRRVAAADESALTEVARMLVEGTSASAATVWLMSDGSRRQAASYRPDMSALEVAAERPVIHAGDVLGSIALSCAHGQRLEPGDLKLIEEVGSGLGLALRNLRLTDELHRRIAELRASRRRIVAVRDDTRRSLERDLHDGAQQQLVALKVKLGLLRRVAEQHGAEQTIEAITALSEQTDHAIASLRDLARGLYPPLLEAEGLGPALAAQSRKREWPVVVDQGGGSRFEGPVESTLYFSAVQLADHFVGAGSAVEIRVVCENGHAGLDILHDTTSSWSPEELADVVDRVAATDGTITAGDGRLEIRIPEVAE
jgi:signal transduction histidine kinase